MDCIFCQVISGGLPSKKVYENEYVYAFHDIKPEAPVHVLIVPKKHIKSILDFGEADNEYIVQLFRAAGETARITGVDRTGFMTLCNTGEDAGQTVEHFHLHILGGKKMKLKL